jgi:glycosyltransferase involved in cell wall biosynthesis
MKNIAIDCRTALAPKTGDRTYCLNLLRGLQKLQLDAAHWRFHLLLDGDDVQSVLPHAEYFQPVVLRAPNSRLWTTIVLPRYARRAALDLVHVQYLAPLLPCPFVTTIHDVVWKVMPETFPRLHRIVMNRALPGTVRRAAKVLCGTQSAEKDIEKYFPRARGKTIVTPYAIDDIFFEPLTAKQIEQTRQKYSLGGTPYVLSVGVQQPRKNVPRLLEAFNRLKTIHPKLPHQLVIAGKHGWGDQSAIHNSQPTIKYIGYVEDADLPALYAGASCFAYPSLYEGFGLPILEAMACGTPVLTSNCGAMAEVASDAAVLVDATSTESIAQGLEKVLCAPQTREELHIKGLEHARKFSTIQQTAATLRVYESVLGM